MDLTWWQPAVSGAGPFTTVHLDTSRDNEAAAHAVELRWQAVQRSLEEQGTPASVIDQLSGDVRPPVPGGRS